MNIKYKDTMVEMRDGTRLATDIYLPDSDNRKSPIIFPTLLHRTPYGKSSGERPEEAEFFTEHGYVVVIQDCRGRYHSEGGFTKYTEEGNDGCDTLAWIGKQGWSNGQIGSYGLSYAAHTQAAMASSNPQNLTCMARLRRIFECVYLRMPKQRRVRIAPTHLGFQRGPRKLSCSK